MTTAPSKKYLLPVIHCIDPYEKGGIGHALANAKIAFDNGADGIFLIGHTICPQDLVCIYDAVRKQYTENWIGVNFLGLEPTGADKERLLSTVLQCVGLSGLWMDGLPEDNFGIPDSVKIFAGVAFKGRNPDVHGVQLDQECDQASLYANVATTSGRKTGVSVDISKLKKIHDLLEGRTPLAVASGVDEGNAERILEYTDYLLVASSITMHDMHRGGHEYFIPEKVRALSDIVKKKGAGN